MKPYPDYKPTGLAWLPEIPKRWKLVRGKNLFKKANRPVEEGSEIITCFRDGEVTLRKNRRATGFTESLKEIGYQGIKKGDLVIHVMDAFAGAIGVSDSDGKGTPVYNVCIARTPDTTNNYYFAYIVRVMAQTGYIQSLYRGIRERSSDFRFEVFANQPLPFPPADEQAQIVRYLDAMTAKINKLIRAKKRQIALLQEQKQAIINQAVTRGLDPDVELKDSGIDWLGPIPKQWQIVRMKNLFSFINRGTTPDYIEDRSYTKVVNQATFSKGYWDETQIRFTRVSPDIARGLLKQNDVLLASTGGGVLGKVYLFIQNGTYIADSHVTILRTQRKDVSPAYFFALLSTMYDFINAKLAKGSTNQTELQKDLLCSLVVPFPDIETQNVIVDFLDQKINIINLLIQQYQKIIEQYAEYKNSLIAAVVTGKVDVRKIAVEAVAPEDLAPSDDPDESEEQDSPVSEESEE